MSDPLVKESGLLTPRKIAIQLLGFAVGVALLVWCIRNAAAQGGWERLRGADPWLVTAMLGCTLVSCFINGASFWMTVRGLKHLPFWDLQRLNVAANMLNYAPIRLGAIARVMYHVRVDGLGLLQVGVWFATISYLLALGVGSCLLATLIHESIDPLWLLLVLGQMALGVALTRVAVGSPFLARHGRGIDRILGDRPAIWGAAALRLLDLTAYAGRMGIATRILGIEMSAANVVVLAVVALAASLIPFGRLGFREFCVAVTARRLSMLASDVESNMEQLALLESAGEAVVFIPLGAAMLFWYRKRWMRAGETQTDAPPLADGD